MSEKLLLIKETCKPAKRPREEPCLWENCVVYTFRNFNFVLYFPFLCFVFFFFFMFTGLYTDGFLQVKKKPSKKPKRHHCKCTTAKLHLPDFAPSRMFGDGCALHALPPALFLGYYGCGHRRESGRLQITAITLMGIRWEKQEYSRKHHIPSKRRWKKPWGNAG